MQKNLEEKIMRPCYQRLSGLCAGALLALSCVAPAMADDTEIFIGAQSGIRPNIVLILDTSGSMSGIVQTQQAYDPGISYGGSCDTQRVYYRRDTGIPPACSDDFWFNASALRCDAAVRAIASSGTYIAQRAAQWNPRVNRWENIDRGPEERDIDQPVECRADAGIHGENAGDSETYAYNSGQPDVQWTSVAADQLDWDSSANKVNRSYTFYDGNYLNWYNNPILVDRTRLEVVQEAATNLVGTISGVNIGLMRYSNNGGDGDAQAEGGMVTYQVVPVDSARAELIQSINANTADGFTPLSETLYEAHQYFAGGNVFFGVDSQIRPGEPLPSVAASRRPGNPELYLSPAEASCQKNFIVYLTDGLPTQDNSADDEIEGLLNGSCDGTGSGRCLDDLAGYMFNNDLRDDLQGNQNVTLYTIGFGSDVAGTPFLEEVAAAGGGQNFFAGDTATLTTALTNIVNEILTDSVSFVAPTVAVNAFNRTETLADLYISVFEPSQTYHWPGNLKKYRLQDGELVDADGQPAIDPATGFFAADARSFWSGADDGANVEAGGAANEQPASPAQRRVFTFLGDDDLTAATNRVNAGNLLLTDAVLGLIPAGTPSATQLLDWIVGYDVKDADNDGDFNEARRQMGDPLHGQPAVVIYGGTAAAPDAVVFTPTNDGYLHAVDADDGTELWSFIPAEVLDRLVDTYRDEPQSSKSYALDGDIRAFKIDTDLNGIVEPSEGDRVLLFFGMRRGGDRYFALDVTDKNDPRHLWTLGPGELPEVGQTWATPAVARVAVAGQTQNALKLVLIFGGGYDETQDNDAGATFYNTDALGNRIFMVDALSGDLLWYAGGPGGTGTPDLVLDRMNNSIPSNVRVLDLDGNGFADRMYVGDTGGRLWRLDVFTDADPATPGVQTPDRSDLVTGGVLASLGNADETSHPIASTRKFYETPDVSLVRRRGAMTYLNIALGSGWRGHPLNTEVEDRFYAIRDYEPFNPIAQTDFDARTAILDSNLADITTNVNPLVPDGAAGWKLELRLPGGFEGEKVLAESRTFNGVTFFPTYLPSGTAQTEPCAPAGSNRAYAVSVNDGRPVTDINRDNQTTPEDRYTRLAQGGIAPEFSFFFPGRVGQEPGPGEPPVPRPPVRCAVGVEIVDGLCASGNTQVRTYWRQSGTR